VRKIFDLHKTTLKIFDDIAGKTNSELRFPFLNLKVVELMYSISDKLKIPLPYKCCNGVRIEDKYILRKSFDYLCDEIL
jgi:hypothetical protein